MKVFIASMCPLVVFISAKSRTAVCVFMHIFISFSPIFPLVILFVFFLYILKYCDNKNYYKKILKKTFIMKCVFCGTDCKNTGIAHCGECSVDKQCTGCVSGYAMTQGKCKGKSYIQLLLFRLNIEPFCHICECSRNKYIRNFNQWQNFALNSSNLNHF